MAGDARHPQDYQLVMAAKNGDPEAVGRFAQRIRCAARFLSIQNRRLGSPVDEAELADLAQNVTLIVLRKLGDYEGRGSIESWIYRIARIELLVFLRDRGRKPVPQGDLFDADLPSGDGDAERFAVDAVHRGLAHLRPGEVELVELRHLEGLAWDEIGERLDCPANTAKTRYHRALARLRDVLRRDLGEDA